MTKIFISYRRAETIDITGRVYDWLVKYFGKRAIFRDLNAIPYGVHFRKYINNALHNCGVMLLIIGKDWAEMKGEDGSRRLDDVNDPVRLEIEEAMINGVPIIPVLVQDAAMPKATQFPEAIRDVHNLNAIKVSSGSDFPQHMVKLISGISLFVKLPVKKTRHTKTKASDFEINTDGLTTPAPEKKAAPEKKTAPLTPPEDKVVTPPMLPKTEAIPPVEKKPLQVSGQKAKAQALVGRDGETRAYSMAGAAALNERTLNGDTVIVRIPQHVSRVAVDARKMFDQMEWCSVAAGKVTIQTQSINAQSGIQINHKVHQVDAFKISKFLITNAQFNVFTAATDGYRDRRWWQFSEGAKAWRQQNPVAAVTQFVGEDLPRVHINWYEAMAFCYWLSYKVGLQVRLPNEQQWQRAAQGNDQREYPWGNVFDPSRANTLESGMNRVTPVKDFSRGVSQFGLHDMGGNVQQWTLTEYGTGSNNNLVSNEGRVIRGGSWKHKAIRLTQRFKLPPTQRADCVGFRIVIEAK